MSEVKPEDVYEVVRELRELRIAVENIYESVAALRSDSPVSTGGERDAASIAENMLPAERAVRVKLGMDELDGHLYVMQSERPLKPGPAYFFEVGGVDE